MWLRLLDVHNSVVSTGHNNLTIMESLPLAYQWYHNYTYNINVCCISAWNPDGPLELIEHHCKQSHQ